MTGYKREVTLKFTFISDPGKPMITLQVPREIPFEETLILAAKKHGKDPSVLRPIYPAGTHITGGTVEKVIEHGNRIYIIDPSVSGSYH